MASSPRISIRISEDMDRELREQADSAGKSPSILARELLAKALRQKALATMRPAHRPIISKKT
jgi:predicted transcriptional regulator